MSMLFVNYFALSGWKNSKIEVSKWEMKSVTDNKSLKTPIYCGMRITFKRNNDSWITYMWHEKPSLNVWKTWERSRRWKDGFHEMKERQQKNRKHTCEILLAKWKIKLFLYRILTGYKSGFISRIVSIKVSWVTLGKPLMTAVKLRAEGNALSLVGSAVFYLVWATETCRNR